MYLYVENESTCPYYNLALEQAVFDRLDRRYSYCMLWRNDNAVIAGKHQISAAEICPATLDSLGISLVRRLSGGGAVYHDLGNINFTFITDAGADSDMTFAAFCKPVQEALVSFGVPAEISGRNDMTVKGKKISGNARYIKENRIMHHGTLLYDSNLDILSRVLNPGAKAQSAGIQSIRSRVCNIRPFMHADMNAEGFRAALKDCLVKAFAMQDYELTPDDIAAAQELKDRVYSRWEWNYGASPPYNIRKSRCIAGCGTVEAFIAVGKEGIITGITFYGDFFSKRDPAELAALCTGRRLERQEISAVLRNADVSQYFYNMDKEGFLALLFE